MKNFKIKAKLILLFVVIKVIPLLIISYIAIEGAKKLDSYFSETILSTYDKSKMIIENTAKKAIDDSVQMLDKKSKTALERLSFELANSIANFLYERDNDILFLSNIDLDDKVLSQFFDSKKSKVLIHENYIYNDKTSKWESSEEPKSNERAVKNAILKDNQKEFNYIDPKNLSHVELPIYKEISFIDLDGNEIYKKSNLKSAKVNVFDRFNTYLNAEDFKNDLLPLKKGEIFVSDVIGEYVGTKVIGTFTKEKAAKSGIEFMPENYAYAGKENPIGKRFEAIIRFITPVYKDNKKVGYVSMALDHKHIMEFTDTCDPVNPDAKQNIKDASMGNYAFMWDYEGKNIAHARDYFIVGYDKSTGKRVPGWLSKDIADKFKESKEKDLNKFLENYPKFEEQSLSKKPNIAQLKANGEIGLDCRYLNFAPQCQGWMQLTENGGYGSFVIYWSKVWKLTTAAAIPYYTGKYANSKRGFGFVTIGANVDEFHSAANAAKNSIDTTLTTETNKMKNEIELSKKNIDTYVGGIINELSVVTILMLLIVIFIAIWMSNYLTGKIRNLIVGTEKFAQNDFDYNIKVTSSDEIGMLEKSFNEMASRINNLLKEQRDLNEHLEQKVEEKTAELRNINEKLEDRVREEVYANRQKDVQLVEQSKMAAIGEMISLIIHQWKQPLNAIGMINSRMRLKVQLGDLNPNDIEDDTDGISKQITLMSETMNDFRNFFKNTNQQDYNVTQTIKNAINLIGDIYKSINVFIDFKEEKEYLTKGFPNEIIQVLINIMNNARDEIISKKVKHNKIDINLKEDDKYVVIEISDYAGGIPDKIIDNLFEAYFTTKDDDKGTGLGLYMSKSIVEKVNGEISVENITREIDGESIIGALFSIKLLKN